MRKERPYRKRQSSPCTFFHLLTVGDPERGLASSSRKPLISVLRSPVIFIGILLFLLDLIL